MPNNSNQALNLIRKEHSVMKVVNRMKGQRANSGQNTGQAESTGAAAFAFLAAEPEYFSRFADITGIDLTDLKQVAGSTDFLAGVLEYLLNDESLLLNFCENNNIQPEIVQKAQMILSGTNREF